MESVLVPICKEEFEKIVKIKCDTIFEGLNKYFNGMLEYRNNNEKSFSIKENYFISFLKETFSYNKHKPVIVDFYLKDLTGEQILNLLNALDDNDKIILLDNLKNLKNDTIYFKVCFENLIPFIAKLNTRSLFFCTIYFLEKPCTIWGNYDLSFPCLFEKESDLKFYEEIAKKHNLRLSSIDIKQEIL